MCLPWSFSKRSKLHAVLFSNYNKPWAKLDQKRMFKNVSTYLCRAVLVGDVGHLPGRARADRVHLRILLRAGSQAEAGAVSGEDVPGRHLQIRCCGRRGYEKLHRQHAGIGTIVCSYI